MCANLKVCKCENCSRVLKPKMCLFLRVCFKKHFSQNRNC